MITHYNSDKIKILSLVAILLVLYIHSGFHNIPNEIMGMKFNNVLQDFISNKLGRCAVPLFYMISGYLYFLNVDKGIISIIYKIKKRVRTLLIPFFLGCLFFPLFFLSIEWIPLSKRFLNSQFSSNLDLSVWEILMSLFIKTKGGTQPWAFHLWFLRDLIIIVVLSPILYYFRKYLKKELLVLILFTINIFCPYSLPKSIFWFMLGDAYLTYFTKLNHWILPVLFILISVVELAVNLNYPIFELFITLMGVISIWNIYDYFVKSTFILKDHRVFTTICGYTFFIYLYHEPTLNIIRKLLTAIIGTTSFGFATSYLLSPWIFAASAILVGILLKRFIPRIYNILVGGR